MAIFPLRGGGGNFAAKIVIRVNGLVMLVDRQAAHDPVSSPINLLPRCSSLLISY
jgi:hypothetical protein